MTRERPTDGERGELTAAFVSRRVLECDGALVRRLAVRPADVDGSTAAGDEEDGADTLALLVAPDADDGVDLAVGDRVRFEDLRWFDREAESESVDIECPHCGGDLHRGTAVDTLPVSLRTAVDRLGLTGAFAVITAESRLTVLDGDEDDDDRVDDWRPLPNAADSSSRYDREPPAFICPDCGRHLSAAALERARRLAEAGEDGDGAGMDDLVQHALENPEADMGRQMAAPASPAPSGSASESLGMATGGAKDVDNFRENVREGFTPQPSAITDEGLFYDYHFETGGTRGETDTEALFTPRYATGVSEHPLSGAREHYLAVGLDSTLSAAEFERPRLDLVVALDVSGSMDSPFDAYHYDEHGRRRETDADDRTKLEAAVESICALTEQLADDDRLGIVLYDHRGHVAKPLRAVGETDMRAIRGHLRELRAGGGTNLADGFEAARDLLADGERDPDTERRVVFATDMMPNTGTTGESELTRRFADAAADGVHTTFVGMGLDANADLAETLSGIRGANHYFVTSADEFERRLGEEFAYMVSPLVYDLGLEFEGDGWEVAAVHGSPTADAATGRLLHVGTLFPSPKRDGETRGGVVLVRLERTGSGGDTADLVASWTERDGGEHLQRVSVDVPEREGFDHDGVRKAVVLARYARELRTWAADVHGQGSREAGVDDWLELDRLGDHERRSVPLAVPERYARRFRTLRSHLAAELETLGDADLERELDLLDRLCEAGGLAVEGREVSE
jgi:Ca-activated chloride channel family protein